MFMRCRETGRKSIYNIMVGGKGRVDGVRNTTSSFGPPRPKRSPPLLSRRCIHHRLYLYN